MTVVSVQTALLVLRELLALRVLPVTPVTPVCKAAQAQPVPRVWMVSTVALARTESRAQPEYRARQVLPVFRAPQAPRVCKVRLVTLARRVLMD